MIKRVQISGFRGLDTSTSIYEVAANRATEMSNIINKDGSNRKRDGVVAIAQFDEKINGMWQFKEDDARVLIVHSGTKLYRVKEGTTITDTATTLIQTTSDKIADRRSYAIENSGILHIFCGDYFMYLKESNAYKLVAVVDNMQHTYIPTTTVSIDAEGSAEKIRANFEEVNLLNIWRINTLEGALSSAADSDLNRTYYLDSTISVSHKVEITISKSDGTKRFTCTAGETILKDSSGAAKGTVMHSLGKIVFNNINDIRIDGSESNNISVKFAHARENQEHVISICNARLGTQFGLHGNNDRLFVAYGNTDYYSGANDYNYFPECSFTRFGTNMSDITGYSRIADGTLGVHKGEGDTSGIYYRSSAVDSYTDEASGSIVSSVTFPITAGAVGQFCVASSTCKPLDGDTMFLSKNGVYSVTLGTSVVSNERYAKERSKNIANTLSRLGALAESLAEVIESRYHLYCGNICFVADSRFKYADTDLKDDTFNYEWYKLDYPFTVTATMFIGNKLYLAGTAYSHGEIDSHAIYIEHPLKYDVLPCKASSAFALDKANNCIATDITTMSWLFSTKDKRRAMIYGKSVIESNNSKYYELMHRVLTVKKIDDKHFRLYKGNSMITLDSAASGFKIAQVNDVHSKFVTPLIDLGSNEYLKTIHGIGAVVDNTKLNRVDVTCVSGQGEKVAKISQGGMFNFNNIDFNMIVFGVAAFTTVQLHKFRQRNVNYLKFIFDSDNDSESIISNLSIEYSYSKKLTRGGNY